MVTKNEIQLIKVQFVKELIFIINPFLYIISFVYWIFSNKNFEECLFGPEIEIYDVFSYLILLLAIIVLIGYFTGGLQLKNS